MQTIRIVLAEDHALMREGTRHILNQYSDLTVVGEAEDGQQALDLVKRLQPDVAILDIRMPKLNGIEVVRQMKEYCPNTKALMFTAYDDDDDYILALMDAGALGYLLKCLRLPFKDRPSLRPNRINPHCLLRRICPSSSHRSEGGSSLGTAGSFQ